MANYRSKGNTVKSTPSFRNVSSARLSQRSGAGNTFGGVTKQNHGNGTFSMKKLGK